MMENKKRIIILGSNSFVAKNVIKQLKKKRKKFILKKIPKKKINLEKSKNINKLRKIVIDNDIIFFVAAKVPAKNYSDYQYNLRICKNIILALKNKEISHFIYLSSDAVYSDIKAKITENSLTYPKNYHGLMHLKREKLIEKKFKKKLTIIRPTLIYGQGDPHNGYGPNKFIRQVKKNKDIQIFGNGEERRDHVHIDDVSVLITEIISKNLLGIYNIASGRIVSFSYIARKCIALSKSKSKIIKLKRKNKKLPHNGYRPFNIKKIKNILSAKGLTQIENGIKKIINFN